MARLSSPLASLKPHYEVVVVGSGYGGAIAACRLAEAGREVCVLERGREFQPGEYPDTLPKALRQMQWDFASGHIGPHTGLYDFRVNDDISVFVGCGLGGTSLINANVALEPKPAVLKDGWPKELRGGGAELREGFCRARKALEPTEYPKDLPSLVKFEALEKAAKHLQAAKQFPVTAAPLPIAVTFQDRVNWAHVQQYACKLCGDCVSGCNYGAKNTLIMNYLPYAKNQGAELYAQVAVRYVEPRNGDGWRVHYHLLDSGREKFDAPTMFLTADIVILAAGTLGSTEILLRSRERGLPLSDKLGHAFSGNSDFLGLGYNGDEPIRGIGLGPRRLRSGEKPVGPGTTGVIDLLDRAQLLVEEGVLPGAISPVFAAGLAVAATLVGEGPERGILASIEEKARRLSSCLRGPRQGATLNTFTYLVMGYDDAAGHMYLEDDRLRISWPGVDRHRVFQKAKNLLKLANEPFRSTYIDNVTHLVTVHPLGGCCMADNAECGVVNHEGQVFKGKKGTDPHPRLYVCDGSVVPRSVGVNPFLTISAIAERTAARLVRAYTKTGQP